MKKSQLAFVIGFFFLYSTAGEPPKEELLNNYDKQLKKFLSNKAPVLVVAMRNKNPIPDDILSDKGYSELEPIRVMLECYNIGCKDKVAPLVIAQFNTHAKRLGVKLS